MQNNLLLIPDGIRRFARKHELDLYQAYLSAGTQLMEFAEGLLDDFSTVGIFPLAAYNLEREESERHALLCGLYESLKYFMQWRKSNVKVEVIGCMSQLDAVDPRFHALFEESTINRHLQGGSSQNPGTIIIYLCYNGYVYIREVLAVTEDSERLLSLVPQWNCIVRTGTTENRVRLSGTFLGVEQARIAATPKLFNDVTLDEIISLTRQ